MKRKYNPIDLIKTGYSFNYIAKIITGKETPENCPPSKKDLIKTFEKTESFKAIAKPLFVTDTVVKKWFKQNQLPTTIKEMKNYINNI